MQVLSEDGTGLGLRGLKHTLTPWFWELVRVGSQGGSNQGRTAVPLRETHRYVSGVSIWWEQRRKHTCTRRGLRCSGRPVGCGIWTEGKMQDEKGLELRTESLGLVCEGFWGCTKVLVSSPSQPRCRWSLGWLCWASVSPAALWSQSFLASLPRGLGLRLRWTAPRGGHLCSKDDGPL